MEKKTLTIENWVKLDVSEDNDKNRVGIKRWYSCLWWFCITLSVEAVCFTHCALRISGCKDRHVLNISESKRAVHRIPVGFRGLMGLVFWQAFGGDGMRGWIQLRIKVRRTMKNCDNRNTIIFNYVQLCSISVDNWTDSGVQDQKWHGVCSLHRSCIKHRCIVQMGDISDWIRDADAENLILKKFTSFELCLKAWCVN